MAFETLITENELLTALKQGTAKKVLKGTWNIPGILRRILEKNQRGSLSGLKETGLIVCIRKMGSPKTVRFFRPITLLNGDQRGRQQNTA
jgi:hypothetical protein